MRNPAGFTALLAILLMMQGEAAAALPTMEIILKPHDVEVVKGQEPMTVQFNGTVRLDKPPELVFEVTLTATTSEGWPAVCVPSNLTISNVEPHDFTCTVSIPENATYSSSKEVLVEVRGHARGILESFDGRGDARMIMKDPPINTTPGGAAPWASLENSYISGIVFGLAATAVISTFIGVWAIYRERKARRNEK